jgi:hypothetical protein
MQTITFGSLLLARAVLASKYIMSRLVVTGVLYRWPMLYSIEIGTVCVSLIG